MVGYHLIKPEDIFWRLPPKSANTLHKPNAECRRGESGAGSGRRFPLFALSV
jgi:hypothetical protein